MPYASTQATRSIAVEKVELTLTADKRWVKVGEKVTFSGRLTKDGKGYAYQPIYILYKWVDGNWYYLNPDPIPTDANGYYSYEASFGYDFGCLDIPFKAEWEYKVYSDEVKVAIAFPTRISIKAPSSVRPGEAFTVSGKLEYEESKDTWKPLAGKTIKIYYNGTLAATVTTGSDGSYSASVTIETPGSYTLKAVFEGEVPGGAHLAPAESEKGVAVGKVAPLVPIITSIIGGGLVIASELWK